MVEKPIRTFTKKELKAMPNVLATLENLGLTEDYMRTLVQRNAELNEKLNKMIDKNDALIEQIDKNNESFNERISTIEAKTRKIHFDKEESDGFEGLVGVNEDATK